ncbi:MaoC family dehydratase N-terminal domain-containing protein [Psychrobacillus soli]|uniref:MaoC family dehydratase n=1 Tax=Psychrobacillus soli TaxID=1543965 RepID=A0A544TLI5_9BACI|nr:MaoC family dehydratase N-terminal domain-containing protein [Psychrobacillus soli]TQR18312.1 MaoC family dehydratase [Psychrobacillus soli]
MLKNLIGKRSDKVKNTIEKGAVRKFAEAIGDPAPIYLDEEVGKNSIYKRNIAPPTFPVTFNYGFIPEMKLPSKGIIHGEQNYHYERPLFIGEEVYCHMEIKDYYEKTGRNGDMSFLVINRIGEDENGNLLFSENRVVILNDAVRKGMLV